MRQALAEAQAAAQAGEVPVGAIVVKDGQLATEIEAAEQPAAVV